MENRKTILLLCANGASSHLLADQMQKHLKEEEEWKIESKPFSELPYVIAKYDCILVAPQISFEEKEIRRMAEPYEDIRIIMISQKDFARSDADAILDSIRREETVTADLPEEQETLRSRMFAFALRLSQFRYLQVIRSSLSLLFPVIIIGSISYLLACPPLPSSLESTGWISRFLLLWKNFVQNYSTVLMLPYYCTSGMIALYEICSVSYYLAQSYHQNAVLTAISSLLVYFCVSGALDPGTMTLDLNLFGPSYLFSAIFITIASVELMRFLESKNIRFRIRKVPDEVSYSAEMLLPLGITVGIMLLCNAGTAYITGYGIVDLAYTLVRPLLSISDVLPSILLINFIMTTFWFFGIHGNSMFSAITVPLTTAALTANASSILAGKAPEYIYAGWMGSVFGNWLTYNAILICMLFWCRSEQIRSTARMSLLPSLFNINEPIIYGLPTVLNIYTYIPLILCNIINTSIYYTAAKADLVGRFYVLLPFTVPGPLQAWIGTGDVKSMILWFILLAVDIAVSLPFILKYDQTLPGRSQGDSKHEI